MARSAATETHDAQPTVLVILSLLAAGIAYVTSIVVARRLGAGAFEDYAVAVASLALMSTFAEAGTGKYALRILPAYIASDRWSLAAGYWRFALGIVVLVSIAIAAMVAAAEGWEDNRFGNHPLGIAVLFLPAAALAGAGVDFVMAGRAAIAGSLIARVVIPGSSLLLILACAGVVRQFHSSWAVACYGSGAVIGAAAAAVVFWRTMPSRLFTESPCYHRATWTGECFSYLILAMMMTWMFRISIVVLEALPIAELEVAWFAAAMETGCLILLLSKSTDKYFQPHISIMLEQEAWDEGAKMRRRRRRRIGSACAAFLLLVFSFGKSILRLYGEPFEAGYPALCLIAIGTCAWTMFSLAPAYLKFVGQSRFVFAATVCGAVAMAGLTGILGIWHGATGAAGAFCIVLCSLAVTNLVHANRHFRERRQAANDQ